MSQPRLVRSRLPSPFAFFTPILFLTLFVVPAGAVLAQTVFTNQVPNLFGSDGPYELGMPFLSAKAGKITAIRHWKAPGDNADHVGRIWGENRNQLAEVTFVNETASGWQEQALETPLDIVAGTTYTVSVNSGATYPVGNGLPDPDGNGLPATNDPLTGVEGVFNNSPGFYPETRFGSHYFRDVVFTIPAGQAGACISGEKRVSVSGIDGPYVRNSVTTNNPDPIAPNPKITFVPGGDNVPDNEVNIPEATFGGEPVLYEFEITNCGDVDIYNLRVDDCVDVRSSGNVGFLDGGVGDGGEANCEQPRLIPTFAFVDVGDDGVFSPGETVPLRSTDDAFSGTPVNPYSSSFIDICETYGNARVDGIVRNDVEFEGEADLNGDGVGTEFVFFDELNLVQCKPGEPKITVEKFTNGYDADEANGSPVPTPPDGNLEVGSNQVPVVKIGDDITWTYVVTNNGVEALTNVTVTDSKDGVNVTCPSDSLAPGASFTCTANGTGLDLVAGDANSVEGCGSGTGMTVPTYENLATVVGFGATSGVEVTDEDPSHYCNPPGVMIEKFTNGYDGDDANGIPAADQGDFTVGAPQVAEVPSGGDITWTYVVTNTSNETLTNVSVIDSRGVIVSCPTDTLEAGASTTCTATGTAEDLELGGDNVEGCGSGTGETRPTYENLGKVTATGETTDVFVEDDDPSHYCNPPPTPECGLTLKKGCEIPPPALPSVGSCDGKLQEYTVIWNGAGPIDISVGDGLTGSSANSANPGDAVTFFTDGSTNDTIVNISGASPGQSTFHVSCSDDDMDGDTDSNADQQQVSPIGRDCGKDQGDGKGDSGFNNEWLLEGFVDNSGDVLDCTLDVGGGDSSCTYQAVAADCDFPVDNPDILTFRVSGGDCDASDNDQEPGKTECTGGAINPNEPVQVSVKDGFVGTLQPGETFDVERGGDPEIELFQGGVSQFNKFHASCSQPLQAGDTYGANELLLLDGNGLGTNVVYSYLVGSTGSVALNGITVTDDKLGTVTGSPIDLAVGDSETLTATAFLTQTTTNTATAVASANCAVNSTVFVTVKQPPDCDVSIAFKELKDDAIKWDLTNGPERKSTMETFTLVFPEGGGFGAIKEVKLDGNIFKADDSDTYPNGVPSGATIGPDDWTEEEVAKRQLDRGEERTLEVKFMDNDKTAEQGDFDLNVTFEEGCSVTFKP